MTYRQAATLACRVLAIWALFSAIELLAAPLQMVITIVQYISNGINVYSNYWYSLTSLIPLAVQIAAGIWLWRRAGVVAAWMTGDTLQDEPDEPDPTPQRVNMEQVQAVVLSSLGVWVLLQVVPRILSSIFDVLLTLIATRGQLARAGGRVEGSIWIWSFQLLLGLWLIFGARGITHLLKRARREAIEPATPT
ncbi:MAG TPA: hypothetical protein VMS30_06410 [Phycisphaerales bacterium]|nr:hypothetical protein [Phycisphaerales bacterium]